MEASTRRIARQRIRTLFSLANEIVDDDSVLAQRYVYLAKRIAMAARLHLPEKYRRQVCPHCKSFIYPGVNCRVRIRQKREPHVVITCMNCGKIMRMPLRKTRETPEL
jgi:ribonuclease P protein subunit RPR2